MALAWNRGAEPPAPAMIADRHLYLDASESRIVEEGDAASAYQFVAKGHPISAEDAARFGLSVVDGVVVLAGVVVASEPVVVQEAEAPVVPAPPAKKRRS